MSFGEIRNKSVVARLSIEAEHRAIALSVYELLWLQKLLKELKLLENDKLSPYYDNKAAAITTALIPIQHDRTKHIEIDQHFIKEKLINGILSLVHATSEKQIVDVFKKG